MRAPRNELTPYLDDGDVRVYVGDALNVLRALPDESVDCCVTSPPYWGLRDYGTGLWAGGNAGPCEACRGTGVGGPNGEPCPSCDGQGEIVCDHEAVATFRDVCGKCGARRVDQQLGLEPTPDEYVRNLATVFREVRRVLAAHGSCWVNLGDSYAGGDTGLKPKDLVGVPWRVAFALQADGWYLRSDIVWSKPNPMPESVTDRPTKAHEYVFLLSKGPRYFFDQEAVREPAAYGRSDWSGLRRADGGSPAYRSLSDARRPAERGGFTVKPGDGSTGRNVRSVWTIATQPYSGAHFATFPEELVRRCLLAGCPARVCGVCGGPSERIVEREASEGERAGVTPATDCGHNQWRPGVCLDPFLGSGTTAKVARDHGRHAVGVELNEAYAELAARRLQQLSLMGEAL